MFYVLMINTKEIGTSKHEKFHKFNIVNVLLIWSFKLADTLANSYAPFIYFNF